MARVTLYEHPNYNHDNPGWDMVAGSRGWLGTEHTAGASSCIVDEATWVFYEGGDFNGSDPGKEVAVKHPGHYATPTAMGFPDDALRSLRPLPDKGICLFAGSNFSGEMVTVEEGQSNHTFAAQSVIVRSGEWALYKTRDSSDTPCNTKPGEYMHLPVDLHGSSVLSVQPAANGNIVVKSRSTAADSAPDATAQQYNLLDKPSVELILDASGSMSLNSMPYKGGTSTRMEVAKDVLTQVVDEDLPDDVKVALRVFGPQGLAGTAEPAGGACTQTATTLCSPLQTLDRAALTGIIGTITGTGGTPIAQSLAKVQTDLATAEGSRLVVLVTDGEETCGGNVLETIQGLRSGGLDVVINIVGFAIDDAALKQKFEDWATAGNGKYYDATDSAKLHDLTKEALSIQYTVWNGRKVVGTSYVDGEAVELAPGQSYDIQLLPGDQNWIEGVRVSSGSTTSVYVNRW